MTAKIHLLSNVAPSIKVEYGSLCPSKLASPELHFNLSEHLINQINRIYRKYRFTCRV